MFDCIQHEFKPLSLGANEEAHSVNKDENNHWTALEQGALHILLSPAELTVAFKETLEMTRGSAEPISVQMGAVEEERWKEKEEKVRREDTCEKEK